MRAQPMNLPLTPCALAIAGFDPSGGAGLIADLRAFAVARVWGCGVPAVLTVQSTSGLRRSVPVRARELLAQVREIYGHQNVKSIKFGALGSAANVRALLRWLRSLPDDVPLVVDPVMRPSRGASRARLIDRAGVVALSALAARATVVTPNIPEAEVLTSTRIRTIADAERAAQLLVRAGARAALVKGGHLRLASPVGKTVDVLAVGPRILHLLAPRIRGEVHGTGCALASLIAGRLASRASDGVGDETIIEAVRWAKNRLQMALQRPARVGDGLLVLPL